MNPVLQTRFADFDVPPAQRGNCIQAAIASVFELELDEVPNFIAARSWFAALNHWLESSGLVAIMVPITDFLVPADTLYLLIGTSPRGEWTHIVVCRNGEVIHDPHPSQDGLIEGARWVVMFVVRDPVFAVA